MIIISLLYYLFLLFSFPFPLLVCVCVCVCLCLCLCLSVCLPVCGSLGFVLFAFGTFKTKIYQEEVILLSLDSSSMSMPVMKPRCVWQEACIYIYSI